MFIQSCDTCQKWEKRKGTPECQSWTAEHECRLEHNQSSIAIEAYRKPDDDCKMTELKKV